VVDLLIAVGQVELLDCGRGRIGEDVDVSSSVEAHIVGADEVVGAYRDEPETKRPKSVDFMSKPDNLLAAVATPVPSIKQDDGRARLDSQWTVAARA
jgi:hypothetical protein